MKASRRVSPWQWIVVSVLLLAMVFYVLNLALGWGLTWLSLSAVLLTLVVNILSFRTLWKATDNPALHSRSDARRSEESDDV